MKTITFGQLIKLYADVGVPVETTKDYTLVSNIDVFDTRYALPTQRWIEDRLGAKVGKMLDQSGIVYEEEAFDCENFALTSMVMAQWCWAITEKMGLPAGLAFGFWGYQKENGIGHGINTAVHYVEENGTGKFDIGFYEPQPTPNALGFGSVCLRRVNLSRKEISTCRRALFC